MQRLSPDLTDALTHATLATVAQFNQAFNRREVDAVMQLMSTDCLFENTWPPPDGTTIHGQDAVREAFADFFASAAFTHFETEEIFATGERATVRWVYRWRDHQGQPGHVRGVDVFRVQEHKVTEKRSYVKG